MATPLVARRVIQKIVAEDERVVLITSRGIRLQCKVTAALGKNVTLYILDIEEQPVLSALLKVEL